MNKRLSYITYYNYNTMDDTQKVKRLTEWLAGSPRFTTEELTQKNIGESYYAFRTPNGPSFDITTIDDQPVVVVTSFSDTTNHTVKQLTSIGQFTDPTEGESYRIIIRLNDQMELVNERCGHIKIAGYTFEKGGYPTADKVFEDVGEYIGLIAE